MTSVPPSPMPFSVSVSTFSSPVRLIWKVPLANILMPYGSSAAKLVSMVATPQNCGTEVLGSPMSSTKTPEVEPIVPR